MSDIDSWDEAACRSLPPRWWYPSDDRTVMQVKHETGIALRLCQVCPIQTRCLEHAMRYQERGIWGGMNEDERRRLARRRQAVKTGLWPWLGAA